MSIYNFRNIFLQHSAFHIEKPVHFCLNSANPSVSKTPKFTIYIINSQIFMFSPNQVSRLNLFYCPTMELSLIS